jgi:hypothetical protein
VTPPREGTMQTVWRALWASRLVVIFSGMAGVIQVGVAAGATSSYDPQGLTAPFGYLANALVAPLARWDSTWYLTIAEHWYAGVKRRMAFFPLYPALMRVVGFVVRSDLVAGVLISLVAFWVALVLLHRLAALDFGDEVARVAVMLVAFCPMAFFLSAVYTESLFLALSVGCVYAARRERWALAGVLGFLAALSRNGGVLLLLPTAWMYFRTYRRVGLSALWLLLIPAGLGAFLAYLGLKYGDAFVPFSVEKIWYRHSTVPPITVWHGAEQAWNGLRQLFQGPGPRNYVPSYAQSAISAALQDVYLFLFLVLGVVALIGVALRMPLAYSLYALAMLLVALADPVSLQPLASLPRYELMIFPFFIWGAQLLVRRRLTVPAIAALAVLLGVFTLEFATWRWVA